MKYQVTIVKTITADSFKEAEERVREMIGDRKVERIEMRKLKEVIA